VREQKKKKVFERKVSLEVLTEEAITAVE